MKVTGAFRELLHLICRAVEMHLIQRDVAALEGHPHCFLVPQLLLSGGTCDSLQPELTSEDGAVQPLPGRSQKVQEHKHLNKRTHFLGVCRGKQAQRSGGLLAILFSLALVRSLSKT